MPSYLLACECGKSQPVGLAQAGGQVVCSCGKRLEVPPLRMLRHLPPAPDQQAVTVSAWDVRKGAIAVCLILASLLAALSLWSRITEPKLPVFNPTTQAEFVDKSLDAMTPLEAWQVWVGEYRPLAERGLAVMESPHAPTIRTMIAQKRFSQTIMLSLAAILTAGAITLAFWPREVSTRKR